MDMIKNFIYAGVGLATTTSEKVKEAINDLVEKGKISDTEGKKIMDDFFKSTENTKDEFESKWNKLSDTLTSKFDLKKNKEDNEVESLKKKIAVLESKLASKAKKTVAKKPAAKKAVTKKVTAKKTVTKKTTVAKKK